MRLLHVVCTAAFAGVERHVATLAAAQHDSGVRVAVVGGDPVAMREATGHRSISVTPATTVIDTIRSVNRFAEGCDLVHVHMTAAELAVALAVRARGIPVVSTLHFASHRGSGRLTRVGGRLVARRISAQIAISDFVARAGDGLSTVVHPGVPRRPDATTAGARDRTVLVAQRLEPEKQTDVALRAFALSGLAARGWQLEIAGDGAERRPLEQLVTALDLTASVQLLGHRADVDALMERAGMMLAPCPIEGLGLSVVEAMAAGLPVIAAGAGGHLETVGPVDGTFLFAPGDTDGAGLRLRDLAADPARRDTYGQELQQAQRADFTLEAQERATDAVYRGVL